MGRDDQAWAVFWCSLLSPLLLGEIPEAEREAYFRSVGCGGTTAAQWSAEADLRAHAAALVEAAARGGSRGDLPPPTQ